MVKSHKLVAYDFATNTHPRHASRTRSTRYWRDVGTIDAYFQAHFDTLGAQPKFRMTNRHWPIYASPDQAESAQIENGVINRSVVGSGSIVDGAALDHAMLRRSVLVERGARLEHCIVMERSRIGRGAHVRRAIIDQDNDDPAGRTHRLRPRARTASASRSRQSASWWCRPASSRRASRPRRTWRRWTRQPLSERRAWRCLHDGASRRQVPAHRASTPRPQPDARACQPGRPWPLGATLEDGGVNFAVFASAAEKVEICLFDADGTREERRIALPGRTDDVWHGFVPGLRAGHALRPARARPLRPAARAGAATRTSCCSTRMRSAHRPAAARRRLAVRLHAGQRRARPARWTRRDNARRQPPSAWWSTRLRLGRRPPPGACRWKTASSTRCTCAASPSRCRRCPRHLRGTFAGLASRAGDRPPEAPGRHGGGAAAGAGLQRRAPADRPGPGATTGATTRIGFFAPEPRYCAGGDVNEFRSMVKALHAAGLEVILDVVYNHTCEGNHLGPDAVLQGHRQPQLLPADRGPPRYYLDFTGTGNTLNASHPAMLRLIMDSLRYWVEEMHVDGFRFDLAPAHRAQRRRRLRPPQRRSCRRVAQDPVLARVKLIAEPWDLGDDGYQVGGFPPGWTRMERPLPRHACATSGAASKAACGEFAAAPVRLGRHLRPLAAAARAPASTWSRCTTASRCTTWSATTTSTTRPTPRTTATAKATTAAGTAAPKARPTTPRSWRCASGRSATSWPPCSARAACRCCWAATR